MREIIDAQRRFFETGKTLDVKFRIAALKRLKQSIKAFEPRILDALKADLGKSATEAYMTEVGMTLAELSFMLKHTKKFARKRSVKTPLAQFYAKTYELRVPYGVALVMSPWNYPFMLTMEPLIDAIAAGNTVVVKPSAYAPETARVLADVLAGCFAPEYVAVVQGGREVNADLLDNRFDVICFTGGKTVGRIVMEKAAKFLTPVCLELGGKSPCLVDSTANLKVVARRIVFGKFLNCGQTCVAPDYLIVESAVKDKLLSLIDAEIKRQFGENPLENPDYGRIVNRKHFERLTSLCPTAKSNPETLQIAPTVIKNATLDHPAMGEEIFGPLLPVLTVEKIAEAKEIVAQNPMPLAFYLFSSNTKTQKDLTTGVQFGGGCVNDTIIHLATSEAGFGGVGESGIGAYHGKTGFETFTHVKTIVDKKTFLDLPLRYQPYASWKDKLIRLFVR